MRLKLVALPWEEVSRPSAAIGGLASYLRRELPELEVHCRSAFLDVYQKIGPLYGLLAERLFDNIGASLYAACLYPEERQSAWETFREKLGHDLPPGVDARQTFESTMAILLETATDLADELAQYDVLGFTCAYGQIFSSVLVCRLVKQRYSRARTILGGVEVSGASGQALLAEYPEIDFVIQGEGEVPAASLLRELLGGRTDFSAIPGLVHRGSKPAVDWRAAVRHSEMTNLDDLPVPDYDEYFSRADALDIGASIPLQSSRGCWWDRTWRTGNVRDACAFCSRSGCSYREKSARRVGEELRALQKAYPCGHFLFVDDCLRPRGVREFAEELARDGVTYRFMCEIRASLQPPDLVRLQEAGCSSVQIGVEGLSGRYLKRLGKGSRVIDNLQLMRSCFELGIHSNSNLLVEFPGATQAEVDETVDTIRSCASLFWPPLKVSHFHPLAGSAVALQPDAFGVQIQAMPFAGLPRVVQERLAVGGLNWTTSEQVVSWQPVLNEIERWRELHKRLFLEPLDFHLSRKPLSYVDGGTFLELEDNRDPSSSRCIALDGLVRDVYLLCMEVRLERSLNSLLGGKLQDDDREEILTDLVGSGLLYREDGRCLSLAVAVDRDTAIRRILSAPRGPGHQG